jgi:hypothetical protein
MQVKQQIALLAALLMVLPPTAFPANHREAPITAIDRTADITDWYAFVSYDDPTKVTLILNVDPLLEPSNGPNYFPFDPNIVYMLKVDNNYDAVEDITFEVRFQTEIRGPGIPVGVIGAGNGIPAPDNAPSGAGQILIPPAITSLDGAGAAGFAIRQKYTVTLVKDGQRTDLTADRSLFAVPANAGPRTMPNYEALARQGIYSLGQGIRVFAGTVDDPFYIDLGGAFDSLNLFTDASYLGTAGLLSPIQDLNDKENYASDSVSGFNVNTIAIEAPISFLTSASNRPVIGTWGATYRPQTTVRRSPDPLETSGDLYQVQRMGNPLINELVVGNGAKDRFSMSQPKDDAQFAPFALDPVLARVLNAIYGMPIPPPPRTDLLPLVTYAAPIAPAGTPAGPVSDMLRLNTSVSPTSADSRKRMGLLAGDAAGFPNGRRVSDDVTDSALRVVAGILAGGRFSGRPYSLLGDGVNANDMPYQETFPYVAWSQSGRDRRHIDPGEVGCTPQAGGLCPTR